MYAKSDSTALTARPKRPRQIARLCNNTAVSTLLPLTPIQYQALQWIQRGHPRAGEKQGYKVSARALEARKLVVIRRVNKKWTAQLTKEGQNQLRRQQYKYRESSTITQSSGQTRYQSTAQDGGSKRLDRKDTDDDTVFSNLKYDGMDAETILKHHSDTPLKKVLPRMPSDAGTPLPTHQASTRAKNILARNGIRSWAELAELTANDLQDLRHTGAKTIREILELALRNTSSSTHNANSASKPLDISKQSPEIAHRTAINLAKQLRMLSTWAARERSVTSITELLQVPQHLNPPADLIANLDRIETPINSLADQDLATQTLSDLYLQLLSRFSPGRQLVLTKRILSTEPTTLQQLGTERGVSREAIRQDERYLLNEMTSMFQLDMFAPFVWRAHDLANELGHQSPVDLPSTVQAIAHALRDVDGANRDEILFLLLRQAGPYKEQDGWFIKEASSGLPTMAQFWESLDGRKVAKINDLRDWLSENKIRTEHHETWITQSDKCRIIGDDVLRWQGSVADKAEALLSIDPVPHTTHQINEKINEDHSPRSVRNRILGDDRFVRLDKYRVGLRAWGFEEYSGIAEEIAQRIEEHGGTAQLEEIVHELVRIFGVSESSVRLYAESPKFIRNGESIRLRSHDDRYEAHSELTNSAGSFAHENGDVSYVFKVDTEVLRGSGRTIPEQVAFNLGLIPGKEIMYSHGAGEVRLTWPLTSAHGPFLGSTRLIAESLNVRPNDFLRLTFGKTKQTLTAAAIRFEEIRQEPQIRILENATGQKLNAHNARYILGASIAVRPSDVDRTLVERGDKWISDLLPKPEADPHLDSALAELDSFLNQFD